MAANEIEKENAMNRYEQDLRTAMHDFREMVDMLIPEGQEALVSDKQRNAWQKEGMHLLRTYNQWKSAKAQTTYHVPVTSTPAQAHSYRVRS